MQEKNVAFKITVYENLSDLEPIDRGLMERAVAAKSKAYAPYSKFKVGAAVLLENGEIVTGNNQENASYPSGLCAERVAAFHAKAQFPEVPIVAIAISASTEDQPAAPCGNCRQAIAEYEQNQKTPIRILLRGTNGPVYQCKSMADLLPLSFNSSYLPPNQK